MVATTSLNDARPGLSYHRATPYPAVATVAIMTPTKARCAVTRVSPYATRMTSAPRLGVAYRSTQIGSTNEYAMRNNGGKNNQPPGGAKRQVSNERPVERATRAAAQSATAPPTR